MEAKNIDHSNVRSVMLGMALIVLVFRLPDILQVLVTLFK
jgi:hypothetical protein